MGRQRRGQTAYAACGGRQNVSGQRAVLTGRYGRPRPHGESESCYSRQLSVGRHIRDEQPGQAGINSALAQPLTDYNRR